MVLRRPRWSPRGASGKPGIWGHKGSQGDVGLQGLNFAYSYGAPKAISKFTVFGGSGLEGFFVLYSF